MSFELLSMVLGCAALGFLTLGALRRLRIGLRLAAIVFGTATLGLFTVFSPIPYPRGGGWSIIMEALVPLSISLISSFCIIHSSRKRRHPDLFIMPTSFAYSLFVTLGTLVMLAIFLPNYSTRGLASAFGVRGVVGHEMPNNTLQRPCGGRLGADFVRTLATRR